MGYSGSKGEEKQGSDLSEVLVKYQQLESHLRSISAQEKLAVALQLTKHTPEDLIFTAEQL